MLLIKFYTETDVFKYSYVDDFFSWIRINSVETITSVFLHIPFVFATYYLTDMIMSWYGNGFHITAPFVKEFHNTLVDSPHRGPVMQSFSVSFVVSLNKLLNQEFICWWFERLCHCKVTHLCHIMILLQNIIFCYFVYLSFWIHTHMLQNLLFRFQSVFSSTSTVVFSSLMFSHLVCWTKWWMNYWGEVSWSNAGWVAAGSPPDTWYFLVQPLACPISTPSDCG